MAGVVVLNFKILGVFALIILLMYFGGFFPASILSSEKNFLWNGLPVKATSNTDFTALGSSCASWASTVEPSSDTSSPITMKSWTSWGKCGGDSGSGNLQLTLPNPLLYKQIYVQFSGNVNAGGSVSSSCASAGISSSLSQQGGSSISLFSVQAVCSDTKSIPSGILFNINDVYLTIPSVQAVLKLENSNPLILSFGVGTGNSANGRSASAEFTLQSIEFTPIDSPQGQPVPSLPTPGPGSDTSLSEPISPISGALSPFKSLSLWDFIKEFIAKIFSIFS